jgi:hypothetical protein
LNFEVMGRVSEVRVTSGQRLTVRIWLLQYSWRGSVREELSIGLLPPCLVPSEVASSLHAICHPHYSISGSTSTDLNERLAALLVSELHISPI